MAIVVKIPKDKKTRLSQEAWILAEAINRYFLGEGVRSGVEAAVRGHAQELQRVDPDNFSRILAALREEGVEGGDANE